MSSFRVEVAGVDSIMKAWGLGPKQALNLARGANHFVAGKVRTKARQLAPIGSRPNSPILRKSIKTKRRSMRGDSVRSDLLVVRGRSRAKMDGAWYWHFVEHGTKLGNWPKPGVQFIGRAFREITPKAPSIYHERVAVATAKYVNRKAARGRR